MTSYALEMLLSTSSWLRYFTILPVLAMFLSPMLVMLAGLERKPTLLTWALLLQPRGASLEAQPTVIGVAFAVAVLLGCRKLLADAEL